MAMTNRNDYSAPQPEPSSVPTPRSRSVMDFDSETSLRVALQSFTGMTTEALPCVSSSTRNTACDAKDEEDDGSNEVSSRRTGVADEKKGRHEEQEGQNEEEGEEDIESQSSCCSCGNLDRAYRGPLRDWEIDNLDVATSCCQSLEEEMERLQVLKSYSILDSEKEPSFERITGLASRIFDVPIALVSLVDLGRQWFMSNRGLGDVRETPRRFAFCAHAILSTQDLLVVKDATADPRFTHSPLVTGPPRIRFYAGAPLICPEGYKLGTLCVIDTKTRPAGLCLSEKQNLRELAALVVDTMVNRREQRERVSIHESRLVACTAHDLLTPLSGIQLNLSLLLDDENVTSALDENQLDLLRAVISCSDMMGRMCHEAIETFRGDVVTDKQKRRMHTSWRSGVSNSGVNGGTRKRKSHAKNDGQLILEDEIDENVEESSDSNESDGENDWEEGAVVISQLVESLRQVIEPYPKKVPITISVDGSVPAVIISDDLKIFRSAVNLLTNACKKTETGSINFHIYVSPGQGDNGQEASAGAKPGSVDNTGRDVLVFECEDTGPGIDVERYPSLFVPFGGENGSMLHRGNGGLGRIGENVSTATVESQMSNSGLGLFSVASNIASLGGEYGFRPREDCSASRSSMSHSRNPSQLSTSSSDDNLTSLASSCIPNSGVDSMSHLTENEPVTGSVFWFSIPLNLPTSTSSFRISPEETNTNMVNSSRNLSSKNEFAGVTGLVDSTGVPSVNGKRGEQADSAQSSALPINTSAELVTPLVEDVESNGKDGNSETSGGNKQKSEVGREPSVVDHFSHVEKEKESDAEEEAEIGTEIGENKARVPAINNQCELLEPGVSGALDENVAAIPNDKGNLKPRVKRALVIDDSITIRKGIDRALAKVGFNVSQACNGMEGLKKLKSTLFDLVLCDFLMPVMDGLDCVQQYRAWESKHRPWFRQHIIGISAHATKNDTARGLEVGMDNFLSKPVHLKTLKELSASAEVTEASIKLQRIEYEEEQRSKIEVVKEKGGGDDASVSVSSLADSFSKPVCLIAEDSRTVAKALVRSVERLGWRASLVENGEDALRLLKMRNWDAVFLDDMLPKLTGSSCVIRFREWEAQNRVARQSNVYLVSGNFVPRGEHSIFPPGFDGALGKPVKLSQLAIVLESAAHGNTPPLSQLLVR